MKQCCGCLKKIIGSRLFLGDISSCHVCPLLRVYFSLLADEISNGSFRMLGMGKTATDSRCATRSHPTQPQFYSRTKSVGWWPNRLQRSVLELQPVELQPHVGIYVVWVRWDHVPPAHGRSRICEGGVRITLHTFPGRFRYRRGKQGRIDHDEFNLAKAVPYTNRRRHVPTPIDEALRIVFGERMKIAVNPDLFLVLRGLGDITGILSPPGTEGQPLQRGRCDATGARRRNRHSRTGGRRGPAPQLTLRRGRSGCQGENVARAGAFGCEWAGRSNQWPRYAQGRRVP